MCCSRGDAAAPPRMLTHGDVMHLLASARHAAGLDAGDERLAVLPHVPT